MYTRRGSIVLLLALSLLVVGLTPSVALASDYHFWYRFPEDKVYPTTKPPSPNFSEDTTSVAALGLAAAQGEYEGMQVAVHADTAVSNIWFSFSDLSRADGLSTIPASNFEAKKVGYVYIRYPSYGYRTVGYQPDPLIPLTLANGNRIYAKHRSIAAGKTLPFYLSFFVPDGTQPGTYAGTVTMSMEVPSTGERHESVIPVKIDVHPFSVASRTLKTSFGVSFRWAMYYGTPGHGWLPPGSGTSRVTERTTFKADQMNGWFKVLDQYRLSPSTVQPAWSGPSNGTITVRNDYLQDYLGTGTATTFNGARYNFSSVRIPENVMPSYMKNPFYPGGYKPRPEAIRYLRGMRAGMAANGYLGKGYVFTVDEPVGSKRAFITAYAKLVHTYAPGVKFMVTAPAPNFHYRMISGVDTYVQRLQFYYRDYAHWVWPIRHSGRQVWIYSHAGQFIGQAPNYTIDAPYTNTRAMGWFSYHTNASGLLYFAVNAWRTTMGSSTARDPYKDPLSFRGTYRMNGDGSLVYPGYYPAQGLYVQGAPPVTSLRLEVLRNGLEDYEYLRLYEKRYGRVATLSKIGGVISTKKATVKSSGVYTFPGYTKSSYMYRKTRGQLAAGIIAP